MVPFKETIKTKNELIEACRKGFEDYSNKRISKNDFCMYFGFTHGEAITTFYEGNYEQLLIDGGFNSGSGAYFSGGINAWKNLRDGKYIFPPIERNDSQPINANIRPLQQIFYGAPGTGKSNTIKREVDEKELPCIRTTFHPDSDYSTFVGAYKPIMEDIDVKVTPVVVENGISLQPSGTYKERRIAYKFVKQAFLKAYLGAWKKYVDSGSIGNTYTSNEFDTGNGRYVINSVGVYNLNLSKEFTFPKSLVTKEWNNLWNDGIFNVPKGQQSGKSVQHAIANWITNKIDDCDKDKFEEGWQKLSDTIRENGRVEVQKSRTYIICGISDDNETLTINVEAQGKSKAKLRPKFNDDKTNASKLEKALIEILKKYDTDFDVAWDKLKKTVDEGTSPEVKDDSDGYIVPQFLVIEEINRGNCAQIFGDIFQLLDRQENGFSEYPIEADTDIQNAIKTAFEEEKEYKLESNIDVDFAIENYTSNYDAEATLSEDVQAGRVMLLPPNLYIWATMNTSDQSLFPIDSAFKRRWDWEYMPIGYKNKTWEIVIGEKKYNWVDFQTEINERIYGIDNSEDKQLGDYFVNADRTGNEISSDTLLNKILFYLWNDVCKDDPDIIFKWVDDKDDNKEKSIKFSDFFREEKERKLQGFMAFLKIDAIDEGEGTNESNDDNSDKDGKEFSYNGTAASMREIAAFVVSDYAKTNSGMNAQQVRDYFIETFKGIGVAHIVETESEYRQRDGQSSQKRTVKSVTIPNGEIIYVSTQWRAGKESDNFYQFMKIVNEQGLGTLNSL